MRFFFDKIEEILRGVNLELMHNKTAKFPAFLLADGGVRDDFPDLWVQNHFILLVESP